MKEKSTGVNGSPACFTRSTQKCWDCARTGKDCSWLRNFEPIPGWKAKKVPWIAYKGAEKKKETTYAIIDCPLFIQSETQEERSKPLAPCCRKCSEITKKICNSSAGTCKEYQAWRIKEMFSI